MHGNTNKGREGEEQAVHYLQQSGFNILHRNWRYSRFEIDIIASKDELLHFIEVKTRESEEYGQPEDSVSNKKIKNLLLAGAEYQSIHSEWTRVQYDILSVKVEQGKPEFVFIQDIYL